MLSFLDVEVHMVEMLDRVLPMEDAGSSQLIARELKKLKVSVHTGTRVESIAPGTKGIHATS